MKRGSTQVLLGHTIIRAIAIALPLVLLPALRASAADAESNPLRLSPDHATASVADLDKESQWWQKGSSRPRDVDGYFKQGWMHVVFRTSTIDADYQRLVELGTDVKADRTPQSTTARLVFHDPEGNELEIVPLADLSLRQVRIDSGLVSGMLDNDVLTFKGIPYAQPAWY